MMRRLRTLNPIYKVGLELFTRVGPEWVKTRTQEGYRIFLDLKFHDIPNTVAKASIQVAELGVEFFTVHLAGGEKMIHETQRALKAWAREKKRPRPKMLGVTVLTSFDESSWGGVLRSLGSSQVKIQKSVYTLAKNAKKWGCDGVVCSPHELRSLHKLKLYKLTPGVRLREDSLGDQSRVMTPHQANQLGSHAIVVGRPITESNNPLKSAQKYSDFRNN
jgi:orotidine-5'-phosphate decarboxylase